MWVSIAAAWSIPPRSMCHCRSSPIRQEMTSRASESPVAGAMVTATFYKNREIGGQRVGGSDCPSAAGDRVPNGRARTAYHPSRIDHQA